MWVKSAKLADGKEINFGEVWEYGNGMCSVGMGFTIIGLNVDKDILLGIKGIDNNGNIETCTCKAYFTNAKKIKSENKLTNNKTFMIKELKGLMSRLLDKDTQTLYKADYINGDLQLTEKGKTVLMEFLFLEHKQNLVKLAEAEIEIKKEER